MIRSCRLIRVLVNVLVLALMRGAGAQTTAQAQNDYGRITVDEGLTLVLQAGNRAAIG